ncbi:hypothetical protein TBK1r_24680 [Stieleria magnilauensis]|uniref:Uncharacterized protein n=1 Tax=Stieleria magnilauensis TaxID=2527963 RepID=A0ABX5XQC0_9BACT|nr:hypothetical protein TBK1r_24680 [Planctomycetes bacterium TBK1r]
MHCHHVSTDSSVDGLGSVLTRDRSAGSNSNNDGIVTNAALRSRSQRHCCDVEIGQIIMPNNSSKLPHWIVAIAER